MTLHRALDEFLAASSHEAIEILEKDLICDAIIRAVIPRAHEIARESVISRHDKKYELSEPHTLTIKGYATPKPSIVAVAFGVSFDLRIHDQKATEERQIDSMLRLDGSCSYSPSLRETSDVLVTRWSNSLKGHIEIGWASHAYDPFDLEFQEQLKQTRYI